jgi:hypothetical protein
MASLCTMIIPATYSARFATKQLSSARAALTPKEAKFLEYVQQNWTEGAVLPKAFGIGLASGIVAATSGSVARSLRRMQARRST